MNGQSVRGGYERFEECKGGLREIRQTNRQDTITIEDLTFVARDAIKTFETNCSSSIQRKSLHEHQMTPEKSEKRMHHIYFGIEYHRKKWNITLEISKDTGDGKTINAIENFHVIGIYTKTYHK